jgi:sulfite reductase (NADPH) flavoprotein alpha-component
MNQLTRPPIANLIPESAPFSPEQRTWLNGFFAGFLELSVGGATVLSPEANAALVSELNPAAREPLADGDDGNAPWHDPAMPLAERMVLAESRPLRRRMMAAMGQQDCGQCGYDCENYSNAIFLKQEERLNLCIPGGKETTRALKVLYKELDEAPPTGAPASVSPATVAERTVVSTPAERNRSRDNPAEAVFHSRARLNKPGSAKETWHLEFDIKDAGLDYTVGDSFGVFATNDPALVGAVINAIEGPPDFAIDGRPLRAVLQERVSLGPAPDALFQLISYITGGERRQKAKALASGEDPDGDAESLDVLAAIAKFPGIRLEPEAFIESLDQLQPRLYSIASSPRVDPGRVALTVDAVRYEVNQRRRLGVASTFLADRVRPGDRIKAYVQKSQGFGLPADPSVPIIMIGPGTGIAPFRAFLHERMASKAPGRNWLFFGHQKNDYDFFYEDELIGMKAAGVLTRLSLAWSRDGDEKFYVQDRMRQTGRDVWSWIAEGAHIYVCGAVTMGKDVERALVDLVAAYGARSVDEAIAFVADLKKKGRYHQDVY